MEIFLKIAVPVVVGIIVGLTGGLIARAYSNRCIKKARQAYKEHFELYFRAGDKDVNIQMQGDNLENMKHYLESYGIDYSKLKNKAK